jgi:hypothetical protein
VENYRALLDERGASGAEHDVDTPAATATGA